MLSLGPKAGEAESPPTVLALVPLLRSSKVATAVRSTVSAGERAVTD